MPQPEYVQRGYLREDFRLFHLKGPMEEQLDWHYHTFHKLIFFLGGTSSYGLEGRSYPLEAGDVILVPQGCVHRPEAAPGAPYERVILYLSAEFLSRAGGVDCPLDSCYTRAKTSFRFVLRPQDDRQALRQTLANLEQAQQPGFGQSALAQAILVQLLILLRRSMDAQPQAVPSLAADEKIAAIMQYLSQNPTEQISIDDLAARFYISKYHMMRRFRAETGYTIHAYLTGKRLVLAREQIAAGMRSFRRRAPAASGIIRRSAAPTAASSASRRVAPDEQQSPKKAKKPLTLRPRYGMILRLNLSECRGCSTTARAPAFQAGDAGSIPVTRSIMRQ